MKKVLSILILACAALSVQAQTQQFENPMIFADVPDLDIIRVDDTYYMVSTTMHFSPGCGIMKSKDLVNWEIINYAYDEIDEGDKFRLLNGQSDYSQGSWEGRLVFGGEMVDDQGNIVMQTNGIGQGGIVETLTAVGGASSSRTTVPWVVCPFGCR